MIIQLPKSNVVTSEELASWVTILWGQPIGDDMLKAWSKRSEALDIMTETAKLVPKVLGNPIF
ncbi:MAG: hypothetical protein ACREBU_02210 [Nitrososphaera sp.]